MPVRDDRLQQITGASRSGREVRVSSKGTTLSMIQTRFPGREHPIARAYGENRLFRELCDDYRECGAAVDRWKRQKGSGAASRQREYAQLLEDLDLEIRNWLDAMEPVSTNVNGRISDD